MKLFSPRTASWMRETRLFVLVAGLAFALAGCKEDAATTVAAKPVVETQTVAFFPDKSERTYSGVVKPRHEINQGFRIAGKIIERLVDNGEYVEAGQVLARIDPSDLDLQIRSAEGELSAATASVAQAEADEQRGKALALRAYASDAEYDRRRLSLAEAQGRLVRAERQLDLARNQRSYATLTASAAGVVTTIQAEAGQVVAAGESIAKIARLDELEVAVSVPESQLDDLNGAQAEVTLWADDGHRFAAKLREVSPEADATTRTYAARFSVVAAEAEARLGMTATLHLEKGSGRRVARLPLSAVIDHGHGPFVYIVLPQKGVLAARRVDVLR